MVWREEDRVLSVDFRGGIVVVVRVSISVSKAASSAGVAVEEGSWFILVLGIEFLFDEEWKRGRERSRGKWPVGHTCGYQKTHCEPFLSPFVALA